MDCDLAAGSGGPPAWNSRCRGSAVLVQVHRFAEAVTGRRIVAHAAPRETGDVLYLLAVAQRHGRADRPTPLTRLADMERHPPEGEPVSIRSAVHCHVALKDAPPRPIEAYEGTRFQINPAPARPRWDMLERLYTMVGDDEHRASGPPAHAQEN